jgi:hypothetical protein
MSKFYIAAFKPIPTADDRGKTDLTLCRDPGKAFQFDSLLLVSSSGLLTMANVTCTLDDRQYTCERFGVEELRR